MFWDLFYSGKYKAKVEELEVDMDKMKNHMNELYLLIAEMNKTIKEQYDKEEKYHQLEEETSTLSEQIQELRLALNEKEEDYKRKDEELLKKEQEFDQINRDLQEKEIELQEKNEQFQQQEAKYEKLILKLEAGLGERKSNNRDVKEEKPRNAHILNQGTSDSSYFNPFKYLRKYQTVSRDQAELHEYNYRRERGHSYDYT